MVGKINDIGDKAEVTKAIRTSVMSKQHGNEDFLAQIIADACSKNMLYQCYVLFDKHFINDALLQY